MTEFKSEPYKIYLESHTRLNNYIKISTVAVDFLFNSKENDSDLSLLLNDLILKSGERWTPRVIKDSKNEVDALKNDLVKSAIIWVYSAFDVFFRQMEGILSPYFKITEIDCDKKSEDTSRANKVLELYQKLKWDTSDITYLIFMLRFYELLRHLIAHNMGKPNDKLIEIANSEDFINSILNWKTKFPKKKISPPPIIQDQKIELRPHHSIIYSEVCLRIAKNINQKTFEVLGLQFFIEKTFKRHLLNVDHLTKPECENLTRYIVFHIKSDFNISINPYDKIYDFFPDDNLIQDYKRRYNSLKNIQSGKK